MVDTELIAQELRDRGHKVEHIVRLSENSGSWEFEVDGHMLTLDAARELLESESQA